VRGGAGARRRGRARARALTPHPAVLPPAPPLPQGSLACRALSGHASFVFCLSFCPRTGLLASGSFDESVRLWDLRAGRCAATLPAHSEPVTAVAFSGDGALLASGSYDGLVRLWDVAAGGACLKTLQEDGAPPVAAVRWAPNDRFLLSASLDARLRLWEPLAARRVRVLDGHANARFCAAAAFLPGAMGAARGRGAPRQLVAAGSEDGAACVWDVQTRELVQRLAPHAGAALALDAHPFRDAVATGGASLAQGAAGEGGDFGIVFHEAGGGE